MVLIPNTLELATLWVTPTMRDDVQTHPGLEFETEFLPMPFDGAGRLDQETLFPESVRGRRAAGARHH